MSDAVVIGAGPNGLVAANLLADAGWTVDVLERAEHPGGAVRSDHGLDPAYTHDLFSSFYPLAVASPVIQALGLERHGLSWSHAAAVLAHPMLDGSCAVLHRDSGHGTTGIDGACTPADQQKWQDLADLWTRLDPWLVNALFAPFPPVHAAAHLAARLGARDGLRMARFATLPVRRLIQEQDFEEPGPGLLLAGCALHADLLPDAPGSAAFGWLMAMLGQQHGWPVPEGGSSSLTTALVRRLHDRGGTIHCRTQAREIVVRSGRAVAVRTDQGELAVRHAVLAAIPATALYGGLIDWQYLPDGMRRAMRRFHWDLSTIKVDWALSGPIPWKAPEAATAGTVHVGADLNELSDYALQTATGRIPARPFGLLGQMTTADPTRSPRGTESAWMYTHVPQQVTEDLGPDQLTGRWDRAEEEAMADRMEEQVERFAPGFRARIQHRRVLSPHTLERLNCNLVGGAINGGTTNLHQQLIFRPTTSTGRPETPIRGLYLASSSAHPGGGVHGACGANAARAALRSQTATRRPAAVALSALQRHLLGEPDHGPL
ncbi:phytoene desaturase family protein [Streptacidiphilus melanogenes]|uniref:phytoene desaturase family protein n=1 Tax=Streptacidiphilus melanogenes TaxID=411235 RepID=UPI0005AAD27C|nr:NAD(P)/FAD-dependent oxidoreductase [Streptacidiphilus melanogenes]